MASSEPLESAAEKASGESVQSDTQVRDLPESSEENVAAPPPPDESEVETARPPELVAIELVPITFGFDDPVHVTSADDGTGRLFVLEKPGRVHPDQEIRYLGASPCRGGDGQDYYGFDCECGSMDRRDEDLVEVDLMGLPPADNRDLEMDEYLLVGPL